MASRNPFLNRQSIAPKNAHGKSSEEKLAKSMGYRLTPASGAVRGLKGDMRSVTGIKVLLEAKSTTKLTLPIDLSWLIKIAAEAADKRSIPALAFSFVTPDGKARPNGQWIAIPLSEYQDLLERADHGKLATK